MTEIKQYWIEDTPKIDDIEEAFKIVEEQNVVVTLRWHVAWSGSYSASIDLEDTQQLSPTEYFEKHIPHVYGV